jgi:hypothetical protein
MGWPFAPESGAAAASSAKEFHAPQASQRPAHFGEVEPQDWQTNRAAAFAIEEAPGEGMFRLCSLGPEKSTALTAAPGAR